jgi:hypothetical protein
MTTKLDMRGVCEERFEGLVYQQGASIRYERVEAINLCVRTLIFGSFSFIIFLSSFFPPLFTFLTWCLIAFSPFFNFLFLFLSPLVSPFFLILFCPYFLAHVVSSLAYPSLALKGWLLLYCMKKTLTSRTLHI